MEKSNISEINTHTMDNPYCTTEDIIRYRKMNERDGIKHLKEKYDTGTSFSPHMGTVGNGEQQQSQTSPSKRDIVRLSGSFVTSQMSPTQAGVIGPASFTQGLTDQDILQVDMFYKSHKTDVTVCNCLANLYFGKAVGGKDHWKFTTTGIPVFVLDSGDHHRKRKLQIFLAEKGTGFVLWKNTIDHLSNYQAPHDNFHTLHLAMDHTKLAGLSFDDAGAAKDFLEALIKISSDPDDDLFKISKSKKKKKSEKKKIKYKSPKKAEISQPCCFVHVTKLETQKNNESLVDDSEVSSRSTENSSQLNGQSREIEITDMVGSKLTLNSESTSSGISEDFRSYDQ